MSNSSAEIPTLDLVALRKAIALYLEHAYGGVEPPAPVQKRMDWPAGAEAATLLSGPPFERASSADDSTPAVYALRLGNARYPHMKLQLQPWPNAEGYLLSVNTHDQVLSLNPSSRDFEAFRALQSENQRLKEAIETAWDQAGLPTFLRYLRNYLDSHQSGSGLTELA